MNSQAVLLDTDVFSALYVSPPEVVARQGHPIDRWTALVTGKRSMISFQTRAEALSGALSANWGTKRMNGLVRKLDSTPTIDEDRDVVDAYARLLAESQKIGHPFGASKQHVGDRWIAACAIAKQVPLLTGNVKHFAHAPGLELLAVESR